jgi:hypothetical protein
MFSCYGVCSNLSVSSENDTYCRMPKHEESKFRTYVQQRRQYPPAYGSASLPASALHELYRLFCYISISSSISTVPSPKIAAAADRTN